MCFQLKFMVVYYASIKLKFQLDMEVAINNKFLRINEWYPSSLDTLIPRGRISASWILFYYNFSLCPFTPF